MTSGFNHLKITVGKGFDINVPYKITEQIADDIFNNDKQLYCHLVMPRELPIPGLTEMVFTMSKYGSNTYLYSALVPGEAGLTIISVTIFRDNNDEIYLIFSYTEG